MQSCCISASYLCRKNERVMANTENIKFLQSEKECESWFKIKENGDDVILEFCSKDVVGDIVIPEGVTFIWPPAFGGCSGITSITIPKGVTKVETYSFCNCSGLTSISVASDNPKYDSRNNCNAIIETESNILISGCKNTIIPKSVTSISSGAFAGCTGLTSVRIPDCITSIGCFAFCGCTGLATFSIPQSVKRIDDFCFIKCSGLMSITIPQNVTSIGLSVFSGCNSLSFLSVASGNPKYDSRNNCNAIIETESNALISGCKNTMIPDSVTSIGYGAFEGCSDLTSITIPGNVKKICLGAYRDCSQLVSVTCFARKVPKLGETVFQGLPLDSATLYVPKSSVGAYKRANQWKDFGRIVGIDI